MKIVPVTALKGKTVSWFTARERSAPFTTEYIFTCADGTTYTLKHNANALEMPLASIERIDGNFHIPEAVIKDGYDPLRPCYKAVKGEITYAEEIPLDWQESGADGLTWSKKTLFLFATRNGVIAITFRVLSYDNESPALITMEERAKDER